MKFGEELPETKPLTANSVLKGLGNPIPIGVVLIVAGLLIGLAALLYWLLPFRPEQLDAASGVPTLETAEQGLLTIPLPSREIPPTYAPPGTSSTVMLLPEPIQEPGGLPSFATMDEAPTSFSARSNQEPMRVVIPKIGIDAPVQRVGLKEFYVEGDKYFQWDIPSGYAVGWHDASAKPGETGNLVLNGHNNIYGEIFRDLIDLESGDRIIVYNGERDFEYEVYYREFLLENGQPISVRIKNATWIRQTSDERLTLVSCWPYATNEYRIIVVAERVGAEDNVRGSG